MEQDLAFAGFLQDLKPKQKSGSTSHQPAGSMRFARPLEKEKGRELGCPEVSSWVLGHMEDQGWAGMSEGHARSLAKEAISTAGW